MQAVRQVTATELDVSAGTWPLAELRRSVLRWSTAFWNSRQSFLMSSITGQPWRIMSAVRHGKDSKGDNAALKHVGTIEATFASLSSRS